MDETNFNIVIDDPTQYVVKLNEQGPAGPAGEQGEPGERGVGINSIIKTATSGLVDTYTITYTDGLKTTFLVSNGNGIDNIELLEPEPGQDVLTDRYRINYTNGMYTTFDVKNGNGIYSIEKTSTSGLVDTYTITFDNGDTQTYSVVNGYSPTASVSKSGTVSTLTVTDQNGTTTTNINDGEAATIAVGTVTTGLPGSQATVTNSGTSSAAVFDFSIPQGEMGQLPDQTGHNGDYLTTDGTDTSWSTITFPTVDQTYTPTSANAQSGIAIAGAGFLTQHQSLANYVTLDGNQNITGVKTFVGSKKIAFKQSSNNDKLGFTLYDSSNAEKGYLEYNPTNLIDNAPVLTLGNYASNASNVVQVGFRRYCSEAGNSGAYNLLIPLIADARVPFNLTTTYTNFYIPLGFTDGNTTILTAKSGVVDLSNILPDISNLADKDLNNLSTNGNNKLHAIKGYMDELEALNDSVGYNYYINNLPTGDFDINKFELVGTPIISNTGIFNGGQGSNNYIEVELDLTNTSSFELYTPYFNLSDISIGINTIVYAETNTNALSIFTRSAGQVSWGIWANKTQTGNPIFKTDALLGLQSNTTYQLKMEYTGTEYNLYLSTNKGAFQLVATQNYSTAPNWIARFAFGRGNGQTLQNGYIDLSGFKFIKNGFEQFPIQTKFDIYQINNNSVTIPYIETIQGDKISDIQYLSDIQTIYNTLGNCNEVVLDQVNQVYYLPAGSLYGKINRLDNTIGDIGSVLDSINGEVI